MVEIETVLDMRFAVCQLAFGRVHETGIRRKFRLRGEGITATETPVRSSEPRLDPFGLTASFAIRAHWSALRRYQEVPTINRR
jgi:hypothetical protein